MTALIGFAPGSHNVSPINFALSLENRRIARGAGTFNRVPGGCGAGICQRLPPGGLHGPRNSPPHCNDGRDGG